MDMDKFRKKVNNTQKKQKKENNKKKLWTIFDEGINLEKNDPIECVYRKEGEREYCDLCKEPVALGDDGFLLCTNNKCGVIYTDCLSQEAEYRFYGADDNQSSDPTRCGMPINPLLEESSYGCTVFCSSKSTWEMRKIYRYTTWQSMPYKEKAHYDEFERIKSMGNIHGIPKIIIDDALIYHKKISEQKTFRGLNRDGILASSIYIACRVNNYPRTAKEIATVFHLDNASATKGCKNAVTIVNQLEKDMNNNDKTNFNETLPMDFIERYCSRLNINKELTSVCKFVASKVQKQNLIPENTPHAVASGIIFFVTQLCNHNISKKNIYDISDISEVTINKCYKKLEIFKDTLIPPVIINKYS
jgi:transcription initiation factor TFIIB